MDWQQKSYNVSSGIHTLKWVYSKNSSGYSGDDCGWVDYFQWTGPSPQQDPAYWQEINYKDDVYGRRSEKKVDGFSTRYLYDGPQVIAEYDGNNNLLRKYIYGPGIDQPVCMIEVADSNAVYYYHFDGLGSVVALSDSSGDTVQTYEYSVYGQVAVEDINHPNPYMFAGRRFDIEIGLYYNRARYYNPFTGRFLQTDPIGYSASMNLYAYCKNNACNLKDPMGLRPIGLDSNDELINEIDIDANFYMPDSNEIRYVYLYTKIDFYRNSGYRLGGLKVWKPTSAGMSVGLYISSALSPVLIGGLEAFGYTGYDVYTGAMAAAVLHHGTEFVEMWEKQSADTDYKGVCIVVDVYKRVHGFWARLWNNGKKWKKIRSEHVISVKGGTGDYTGHGMYSSPKTSELF